MDPPAQCSSLTTGSPIRVQQHTLYSGMGEDCTPGPLNHGDDMEGNLTGTSSGVICPLQVVVNQHSMQGKGRVAGGYSYRRTKERKGEQAKAVTWRHAGRNRASCEGSHESIPGSKCSRRPREDTKFTGNINNTPRKPLPCQDQGSH